MATFVQKSVQMRIGGLNLSLSDLQGVSLSLKPAEISANVYGVGTESRLAGIADAEFSYEGLWNGGLLGSDETLSSQLGSVDQVLTLCPVDGALANPCYFIKGVETEHSRGGAVGDLFTFQARSVPSGSNLIRGITVENQVVTVTGNGTGRQFVGGVASGKRMYLAFHTTLVSGTTPSMTVTLQSDDNGGFASPTNQGGFVMTAAGANWLQPAGPITEEHWRVVWTISGTTPSFTIFAALGIL